MKARRSVKTSKRHAQIVGVITSVGELNSAARMKSPPDLFEIRLDHLLGCLDELETKMSILSAPLIITARHPTEGGASNLSVKQRRALLLRFLPRAQYVDFELRSVKSLRSVLDAAQKRNINRIISFHNLKSTPPLRVLIAKARVAKSYRADIFKVATRTDTPGELQRLFDFAANQDVDLALSVMGIGELGRKSRRELMRRGSVLNYAGVGRASIAGQPLLSEIRRWTLGARHA